MSHRTPRRALVVYSHPLPESFIGSALDRVIAGLDSARAETRITDLYADGFTPELSADEHRTHIEPGVVTALQRYADDLLWCDTLILVYPTWWSGQPAMLKGWIDRVWASGVAWDLPDGADRLKPKLRNVRRLVAVTSHGSSKSVNGLQGEGGKRTLMRSLRTMCHPLARTSWIALYGIDRCDEAERVEFLDLVESRIARLAR
jgi:NAD(P)H dehydrogenase (quinone)